jgi:O-antigen biosynthesis protein WbqP
VVLSFIGICVLLLPIVIIAIAIKCESKGPVFFKQKRVGIHKKNFMILKFRTMRSDTPHDVPTHEMNNPDKWITKVGRFLRKTSLDEIPQIFNIFIGQMSIIGPRPALWNQFDLIEERDKYGANDVRPGLTGWAQVNGRDALEIPDKARYDGEYVEKLTLFFDFKCFFRTIKFVLKKDGVVEGGTGELNRRKKQQEESELKGVSSAEAVLEEVAVTEEKQAE